MRNEQLSQIHSTRSNTRSWSLSTCFFPHWLRLRSMVHHIDPHTLRRQFQTSSRSSSVNFKVCKCATSSHGACLATDKMSLGILLWSGYIELTSNPSWRLFTHSTNPNTKRTSLLSQNFNICQCWRITCHSVRRLTATDRSPTVSEACVGNVFVTV